LRYNGSVPFLEKVMSIIKWLGSKKKLIKILMERSNFKELTACINTIIEPFAGSMGLSIASGNRIVGNDTHYGLYCFWFNVWKRPRDLYNELMKIVSENRDILAIKEEYHSLMGKNIAVISLLFRSRGVPSKEELDNFSDNSLRAAALFLYLKKNYRTVLYSNILTNEYLMPWNTSEKPEYPSLEEIENISKRIDSYTCYDFSYFLKIFPEETLTKSLIYFDPPRVKGDGKQGKSFFSKYNLIYEWFIRLDSMDALVMYSINYTKENVEKYKSFYQNTIPIYSSDSDEVLGYELVITNFPLEVEMVL
jgi:site-specific DNA-adenine methylase